MHVSAMTARRLDSRGFSLTEILIVGTISTVIVMALGSLDSARSRIAFEVISGGRATASDEGMAGLAAVRLTKDLERADRVVVLDDTSSGVATDTVLVRVPVGCDDAGSVPAPACFDDPANYRWSEYRLQAGKLEYFEEADGGACADMVTLAGQIEIFDIAYRDEADAPPGGDAPALAPLDNNVISYQILWNNGAGASHGYRGEVAARGIAYTDLNANSQDSGDGLLAGGAPGPCS